MEDPSEEIKDVVRGLVARPSLEQQEAVLRKYFAADCTFHHFYVDVESGGVEGLIALYQLGEVLVNYQGVQFHDIVYDPKKDAMAVRMTVEIRPWSKLLMRSSFDILVLLELEKFKAEDGRTLRRIKAQRDYFKHSPLLVCIPVIGDIYSSQSLRLWLGMLEALVFTTVRSFFRLLCA